MGATWHIDLKGQVCSTGRYAPFPTNYSYAFCNSHNKTHIQMQMKLHENSKVGVAALQ